MTRPLTTLETAIELGYSYDYFCRIRDRLEALGLTPIPGRAGKKAQRKYAAETVERYKAGMGTPIAGFVPAEAMGSDLAARLAARGRAVAKRQ